MEGGKKASWESLLRDDLGLVGPPILLLTDNTALLDNVRTFKTSRKQRHVLGNIHFLRREIEAGRSEWAYIPGYSMYVDTLTKSLPTSKKAQQIPMLLGESSETTKFVNEILNRPRSRYRKQLEDELLDPEAIGSISELLDEADGDEENMKVFLAFDNAELNALGENKVNTLTPLPTNYNRITTAIDNNWRFQEILEECQDNVDYHLTRNPNKLVKTVSWGDDYV